jgi:hypothetical protein
MLIRLVQTKIGIDRSVYNAIKLSSSWGIHQCYKQDIRRLLRTEDCCIFRVNTICHEESIEARNKTVQEHYGRKMTMFLGRNTKLYDPKNLTSSLQEFEEINIYFSHRSNWCSQQWHEGSHTISKLGVDASGMLIRLVQTKIGIDQSIYNAIKLSSSWGIHQCYKQDIRRLSRTEDCCIFRVNTIRHEESTEARNKTVQEYYGCKMTMFLGWNTKLYDPKNLTNSLQEFEGINICFSHRSNWCSQQWHEGISHN